MLAGYKRFLVYWFVWFMVCGCFEVALPGLIVVGFVGWTGSELRGNLEAIR